MSGVDLVAAALILLVGTADGQPARDTMPGEVSGVKIEKINLCFNPGGKQSSVFTEEDFGPILAQFEGKRLAAEHLAALTQQLTNLYVTHGYVTSGATVPDQPVVDGEITITIVEGGPPRILIRNNHVLSAAWYREHIKMDSERALNRDALTSSLARLHSDSRIRRFDAILRPAGAAGESELDLKVEERFPITFNIQFNNYQSPAVGAERVIASAVVNRVLGIGDQLQVSYGHSTGVTPLISAGYSIPLFRAETTLELSYRKNDFLVIEELFRPLNITSESQIFTIGVRQSLARSDRGIWKQRTDTDLQKREPVSRPTTQLVIGIDGELLRNTSFLLGEPFSFSPGAVDGKYSIAALRFVQEYTRWSPGQVIAVRSRLSVGLDALGATVHSEEPAQTGYTAMLPHPDSRFISWLGQAQVSRRVQLGLKRASELVFRADGQAADGPLLPLEQLPIGGRFSVRGHRENELVRDQGFAVSTEFRYVIAENRRWTSRLDLAPFVDYGYGIDKASGSSGRSIGSAGIGLRWLGHAGRRYEWQPSFEIYWGALRYHRAPGLRGDAQDRGLHFQIGLSGS
jgi:hemolysin activation/secretion protein